MNKSKNSKPSYEDLGKMLTNIYDSGYINQNQSYKYSFLKGIATGVGGVIGATVVIGIILGILTRFQEIPLIGPFAQKVQTTIQKSN